MSYRDTLDYLFAQLPMYHRIGAAAYKDNLDNTIALCAHLGNPQTKFRAIHVAGTNGKGSVSHLLAAICQAAGLKTGLYISPHYKDFRERIKVNGTYIPRRRVTAFVSKHQEAIERIQPSFFEMCVGMAFDHFAREQVDIAIIEVGLGGRLDSTNIITPMLSVITNISFDHQALLGDTLPKIAAEKAGIIKPGIPVVIGEEQGETMPVFRQKALEMGAELFCASAHFTAQESRTLGWNTTEYDVTRDGTPYLERLAVEAAGPYQANNLSTALQAIAVAQKTSGIVALEQINEATIRLGLQQLRSLTRFMGRWQVIGEGPTVLCDSAHNEAGIRTAFTRINTLPFRRLHIVTGFVNDKDVTSVLNLFPKNAGYYFAKANIPRGLEATLLCEKAATVGLKGKSYASVRKALAAAKRSAQTDDLIVVIGSIFVVAEVI